MDSGQCFRIFIVEESYFVAVYDVIAMNKYVRVYHVKSEGAYFFNCDKSEWDFWNMYFDLDTNYEKFYIAIANSDDNFLKDAAEYGIREKDIQCDNDLRIQEKFLGKINELIDLGILSQR